MTEKVNAELKQRISKAKISRAELSDAVGISESTLFRWLRHELTQDQEQEILNAVSHLQKGGAR